MIYSLWYLEKDIECYFFLQIDPLMKILTKRLVYNNVNRKIKWSNQEKIAQIEYNSR